MNVSTLRGKLYVENWPRAPQTSTLIFAPRRSLEPTLLASRPGAQTALMQRNYKKLYPPTHFRTRPPAWANTSVLLSRDSSGPSRAGRAGPGIGMSSTPSGRPSQRWVARIWPKSLRCLGRSKTTVQTVLVGSEGSARSSQ